MMLRMWVVVAVVAGWAGVARAASLEDRAACKSSDDDKSIAACTKIIDRKSESQSDQATARYNRGVSYSNKGDYDLAIADFDQAVKLKPEYANAFQQRGVAYNWKNDFDRAIQDFDQAIKLKPVYAEAFFERGVAYNLKKNYDRAIADFDQAIKMNPDYADAFEERGNAYSWKSDHDRAFKDYDQAIKIKPDSASAFQNRAFSHVELKQFREALLDYDQAIKVAGSPPMNNRFYRGRGLAHAGLGEHDKAIADYNKALELAPDDPAALYRRGLSYLAKGDMARAIADQARAQVLKPQTGDRTAERERATAKEQLDALLTNWQRSPPATQTYAPATPPTTPVRRVALVIGNTKYTGNFPTLGTPGADAKAVAAALRAAGLAEDDVVEAYDLDRRSLIATLRAFEAKAASADWSIVFYAGHGVRARSNLDYLIPTDAEVRQERDLADEAVSLERVVERIHDARKLQLVILDACRDNELTRKLYASNAAMRGGAASSAPIEAPGLIIAFSARRGQSASDGAKHSPFATALLANLAIPETPLDVMFERIQGDVRKATGDQQTPEVFGLDYGKSLSFGPGARQAAK